MAQSEEELKILLMKVKENEKAGLKLNIQKMKIKASSPITSRQIDGETMETVRDFIFGGLLTDSCLLSSMFIASRGTWSVCDTKHDQHMISHMINAW